MILREVLTTPHITHSALALCMGGWFYRLMVIPSRSNDEHPTYFVSRALPLLFAEETAPSSESLSPKGPGRLLVVGSSEVFADSWLDKVRFVVFPSKSSAGAWSTKGAKTFSYPLGSCVCHPAPYSTMKDPEALYEVHIFPFPPPAFD